MKRYWIDPEDALDSPIKNEVEANGAFTIVDQDGFRIAVWEASLATILCTDSNYYSRIKFRDYSRKNPDAKDWQSLYLTDFSFEYQKSFLQKFIEGYRSGYNSILDSMMEYTKYFPMSEERTLQYLEELWMRYRYEIGFVYFVFNEDVFSRIGQVHGCYSRLNDFYKRFRPGEYDKLQTGLKNKSQKTIPPEGQFSMEWFTSEIKRRQFIELEQWLVEQKYLSDSGNRWLKEKADLAGLIELLIERQFFQMKKSNRTKEGRKYNQNERGKLRSVFELRYGISIKEQFKPGDIMGDRKNQFETGLRITESR